jgi:hypothetical protein
MPLYQLALFLHILGAFGLIASLAVEAVALRGLRAAGTAEQARPWLFTMRGIRIMAPASIGLILVMGLYLMASEWGWRGWIICGLVGLLLIGIIGGVLTGTRMARLGPALSPAQGPLTDQMLAMLRDPVLVLSSRLRIALVVAVLFLMSVKPSPIGSVVVVAAAIVLGLAWTQLPGTRQVLRPSPN